MLPDGGPVKITLADLRAMDVRGVLIYCADYRCGHSLALPEARVDDAGMVVPVGCNAPIFIGGGFDLQEVSLESCVRRWDCFRKEATTPAARPSPYRRSRTRTVEDGAGREDIPARLTIDAAEPIDDRMALLASDAIDGAARSPQDQKILDI